VTAIAETNATNAIYVFRWANLKNVSVGDAYDFASQNGYPDMYGDGDKKAMVMTHVLLAQRFSQRFGVEYQTEYA